MTRASVKARRPRQYMFEGVSKEQLSSFKREIRGMRQRELRAERLSRDAASERTRVAAGVHAAAIVTAAQVRHAEEDELAAMECELNELAKRKKQLFEDLKRSLEANGRAPPRVHKSALVATNGAACRVPFPGQRAAMAMGGAFATGGAAGAGMANMPQPTGNAMDVKMQVQRQPVPKTACTEPWKR